MTKVNKVTHIVFLLFILQNILPLYYGADPEGSTGCSKSNASLQVTNGQGRCWRYCQESSGPWCYTSKDCISDEEKCADYTTCTGDECFGASAGCVGSCPAPNSTISARIGEPSGSTGCSKKWDGFCWRYCKGSTGSWCYTREGCIEDEESCANYDTCGSRGCDGASAGCVYKCHETQCLKFIKHKQGKSTFYSLQISDDSRVLTKDPEVRPFIQVDELRTRKKRGSEFTRINCWDIPDVDYGIEQVFERHIKDLELDPNVFEKRPRDAKNPVEVVHARPVQIRDWQGVIHDRMDEVGDVVLRPEVVVAEIHPRHLNPNHDNHFPDWTTDFMRNSLNAENGDIIFHLVPKVLGGPPELYNMVPGHTSVKSNNGTPRDLQRNDWPSVERAMRRHLQSGNGNYVRWYVGLYYDDTETGRPTHFTYMAILINGSGNRTILFGSSENRQL